MHNAIAVGILMLVTSLSFLLAFVLEWGCLALMFRVLHGRFLHPIRTTRRASPTATGVRSK